MHKRAELTQLTQREASLLETARANPRNRILAITAPLTAVLLLAGLLTPSGFAVRSPGPTEDTLGAQSRPDGEDQALVTISGIPTYPASGRLLMTTVAVSGGPIGPVFPADVVVSWAQRARAVLPSEAVFPPDVTREEQAEQSAAQMISSKEAATAAALNELGVDFPVTLTVGGFAEDSLATDVVQEGDELVSLEGVPIDTHANLLTQLEGITPGAEVTLRVNRDGETLDLPITTTSAPTLEGGERAALGIFLGTQFEFPFDVDIQIERIGGPSAGMMFALAIIDRLTPEDELHGVTIAGTGTIDADGNVGPIGGIEQKLVGAHRDGADWFLAPDTNCPDVVGSVPSGLRVVRVATLHEARQAMEAIGAGEADALPSCDA